MQNGSPLGRLSFCVLRLALCVLLLLLPGCNVIGAVAGKVGPPPTIPAKYPLPQRPTAVVVENFHNPASMRVESESVARRVVDELEAHAVAPLVDPGEIETLRERKGAAYRAMPLDAIAREVGAAQVVYVDLQRFDLIESIASEAPGATAEAHVRVVDAETGESLWPLDSAGGYPLTVTIDPKRVTPETPDGAVKRLLHETLADRVAKLFYAWQGESLDGAGDAHE